MACNIIQQCSFSIFTSTRSFTTKTKFCSCFVPTPFNLFIFICLFKISLASATKLLYSNRLLLSRFGSSTSLLFVDSLYYFSPFSSSNTISSSSIRPHFMSLGMERLSSYSHSQTQPKVGSRLLSSSSNEEINADGTSLKTSLFSDVLCPREALNSYEPADFIPIWYAQNNHAQTI